MQVRGAKTVRWMPSDGHSPYVGENGNWWQWNDKLQRYVDTGMSAKGVQGMPGQIPFQKEWKAGDTHRNDTNIVDYIYVRSADPNSRKWYKLKDTYVIRTVPSDETEPSADTLSTYYEEIPWMSELAINVLLVEEGNIANFIFKDGKLISVRGTVDGVGADYAGQANFVPNIVLDGKTGKVKSNDTEVRGIVYATNGEFTGTINATSGTIGGFSIRGDDNYYGSLISDSETVYIKAGGGNSYAVIGTNVEFLGDARNGLFIVEDSSYAPISVKIMSKFTGLGSPYAETIGSYIESETQYAGSPVIGLKAVLKSTETSFYDYFSNYNQGGSSVYGIYIDTKDTTAHKANPATEYNRHSRSIGLYIKTRSTDYIDYVEPGKKYGAVINGSLALLKGGWIITDADVYHMADADYNYMPSGYHLYINDLYTTNRNAYLPLPSDYAFGECITIINWGLYDGYYRSRKNMSINGWSSTQKMIQLRDSGDTVTLRACSVGGSTTNNCWLIIASGGTGFRLYDV